MNVRRPSTLRAGTAAGAAGLTLAVVLSGCGLVQAQGEAIPVSAQPAQLRATQPSSFRTVHRSTSEERLRTRMRLLWEQHMEWTYATVAAFAADTRGLPPTLDRLLTNQADLGAAIEPYYGQAAAARLTALLTTHIKDAVPVLVAARAGDAAALHTAVVAWYANARQIADFLAGANPHWQRAEMRTMMRRHITQTITYAGEQLTGHYAQSIVDYDAAEAHMLQMADMLTAGIVAQFPDRFAGTS
ncbi:MAG TPA: hypothetical protein VFL99_08555 [Segeticoccus sp.]|uniref:hypothetical protein n=1 Tax=Segeticoccus sp. TaxID=2706531 RepID=UPI002D80E42C|nr:hypothetical protein [Segeticoccus sp.]HET8600363.1 hypothetical protein [Segeticoccus sp.]